MIDREHASQLLHLYESIQLSTGLLSHLVIPQTPHRNPFQPLTLPTITLQRIPHLPLHPRQEQESIVLKIQDCPCRIIQPRPHGYARLSLNGEFLRLTVEAQNQARVY